MLSLHGKTVLIAGASSGVGALAAQLCGQRGAHVIAHFNRDRGGAERATADITPDRKRLIQGDPAVPRSMNRVWGEALAWRNRVDVLINNVATLGPSASVEDGEDSWDQVWDLTLRVNVLTPVRLIRHAVRHFRAAGGGIVITIASCSAERGAQTAGAIATAASQAALRSATQTVARTSAVHGVLAYVIAPDSDAVLSSAAARAERDVMLRWDDPEDHLAASARLAAFLAAGQVRHLTGATLDVNGANYVRG
jgi:3-oxoacyl-[acyl-carrier protein] reductase